MPESANSPDSMEKQGTMQEINLKEIIRAAREAASMHGKEWIQKQIGGGASKWPPHEERMKEGPSEAARDQLELAKWPKEQQRNTSRGGRKGDKKETGGPLPAVVPGPIKRAKATNGEQISMIVQECLKSTAPFLFAKQD
ncbi:hypothetical protein NDU88_008685 [Pleurodeles waltl]|uniref:Uncharacterized protein n=1 Tax=Pleurodeles waltl TaxID=8319 RepID=A0AAV7PPU7_PLEWA|nr:hypothetical protein NDU88_008685 [Pleurodeles waltl]